MCAVCVELAKGTITRKEAMRALYEIRMTADLTDPEKVEEAVHAQDLEQAMKREEEV